MFGLFHRKTPAEQIIGRITKKANNIEEVIKTLEANGLYEIADIINTAFQDAEGREFIRDEKNIDSMIRKTQRSMDKTLEWLDEQARK